MARPLRLSTLWPLLSGLAVILGFAAVSLVNLVGGLAVGAVLPGSIGAGGMPTTAQAQTLYLPVLFLAGLVGALAVVFFAPRKPWAHAGIFCALALIIDISFVVKNWPVWPVWFSALMVLTVPPQIWAGAMLGLRLRRRYRPHTGPVLQATGTGT